MLLQVTFVPRTLGQFERVFSKLDDLFGGEKGVSLTTEQLQLQDYVHLEIALSYTVEGWKNGPFADRLNRLVQRSLIYSWKLEDGGGGNIIERGGEEDE